MKYLSDQETKITVRNISAFEDQLGVTFPDAYRQFLLSNNGGYATSKDCRFEEMLFHSISDTPNSLESAIEGSEDIEMVPIGETLNEDPIYIGSDDGVYYLSQRVANTFQGFVNDFLIPFTGEEAPDEVREWADHWISQGRLPPPGSGPTQNL